MKLCLHYIILFSKVIFAPVYYIVQKCSKTIFFLRKRTFGFSFLSSQVTTIFLGPNSMYEIFSLLVQPGIDNCIESFKPHIHIMSCEIIHGIYVNLVKLVPIFYIIQVTYAVYSNCVSPCNLFLTLIKA